MKINRVWAMSNSHTFSISPIRELIDNYICCGDVIVDPFANDSTIGTITNDLNPKFDTDYHMDALDFLKSIDTAYALCRCGALRSAVLSASGQRVLR